MSRLALGMESLLNTYWVFALEYPPKIQKNCWCLQLGIKKEHIMSTFCLPYQFYSHYNCKPLAGVCSWAKINKHIMSTFCFPYKLHSHIRISNFQHTSYRYRHNSFKENTNKSMKHNLDLILFLLE